MKTIKRVFTVNGKPFFPLGGQARNSSGYNALEAETAFQAVKLLHGNTLEIPVYWEQIEPEEGQFDFASVDALLESARRYGLKLVLLWFGTWKNGNMEYAPAWVKTNPQRFKRVISASRQDIWVLSSHCQATFEADRSAFVALCRYLKQNDTEHAIIALQIENEPGILGSDRDYGPEAQAIFEAHVPQELLIKMKEAGTGSVYNLWQAAGGLESGNWTALFGAEGGELMTAWSIATYIDRIAEAGKAIWQNETFDMPMYINVWLGEGGWRVPGESYPSGGAVSKVLDIYCWCTPHIDLIAPDIYIADSKGYEAACASYAREDNSLFVPESGPQGANAWNLFRAIADYNAIGYAFFAVEHVLGQDISTPDDSYIRPETRMLVESFRCVAAAIPLLLQYQGTGKIHAVVQEEAMGAQHLDLDGYIGMAQFGGGHLDWRHWQQRNITDPPSNERGRGLVVQISRHEFYVVGAKFRLFLRPKLPSEQALHISYAREHQLTRLAHYVLVDEGHFDEENFVIDRRRNGDETDFGVWVESDVGVVHIVMCD
ncbi:MAG: DUF5597 domain-containing protein [Anaerolineae bacterium]|nr:DUF5597 domain-containing protein [Anaerolineae bacterium]